MTNLRKLFPLSVALFALVLVFSSCEKDNIQTQEEVQNENVDNRGVLQLMTTGGGPNGTTGNIDCFTFEYPITVLFPDGSEQVVSNDEELETVIDFWYENNGDTEEDITLQFPVNVTLEDGSTHIVNDEDMLDELLSDCFDDEEDEDGEDDEDCEDHEFEGDCFTFVYPISVSTTSGVSTINSDEELDALWDTLEEADEDFELVYPVSIVFEDDNTTLTLNSEEELDEVLEECYGDEWDEEDDYEDDCFSFVYPISVSTASGVTTVNSDEELEDLWEELEDADEDFELVFPLSIVFEDDNTTLTLNFEEELDEVLLECYGDDYEDFDFSDCFEVVYPVSLTLADGSSVTVNNDEELEAIYDELEDEDDIALDYPISLVLAEDGTTVTVNNDEELEAILDDCE